MADLGAIGVKLYKDVDDVYQFGSLENFGPVIVPLLSVAPPGITSSPNASLGLEMLGEISGRITENSVPVPDAIVVLLRFGRYGRANTTDVDTAQNFAPLYELVRQVKSNENGYYAFHNVRTGPHHSDYTAIAYNPDSNTENARAVGRYVTDTNDVNADFDFAMQNPQVGMFFILA